MSFYTSYMKSDEQPEGFVSRRGKRVTLESVNISELSIDNVPGDSLDDYKTPRKPSVTIHKSKWFWLTLLLLVAAPVLSGEILAWRYGSSAGSAKTELAGIVSKSVLPVQSSSTLSAAQIGGITDKVDSLASSMCPGSFLDNAATLYPRAKSAHARCVASQEKYSALAAALRQYEAEQRYFEQLAVFVKPVGEPLTEKFAVIGSQLELWQRASDGIDALSPPESMKAVHTELAKQARLIRDQWSKLLKAYDDQNTAAFTTTQKSLTESYKKFQTTHTSFSSVHGATQSKITDAYSQLSK